MNSKLFIVPVDIHLGLHVQYNRESKISGKAQKRLGRILPAELL